MKSFINNMEKQLLSDLDGSPSSRSKDAAKHLQKAKLEIEVREREKVRERSLWNDYGSALTGEHRKTDEPNIDGSVVPLVATLYSAAIAALLLELLSAAALAVLLLALAPSIAAAVGCLLALAYMLICKSTIAVACLIEGRPNQSAGRAKLAAIVFGVVASLSIIFFMLVRIKDLGPDVAAASLSALNLTLPICAAAFTVLAWILSTPNRLAKRYVKLENEISVLQAAEQELIETVRKYSRSAKQPLESYSTVFNSEVLFDAKQGDPLFSATKDNANVLTVLSAVLLSAALTFSIAPQSYADSCEGEIERVQFAVDGTGSMSQHEGRDVFNVLSDALVSINEEFPCLSSVSAYTWSSGYAADGERISAKLRPLPHVNKTRKSRKRSEVANVFKNIRDAENAEIEKEQSEALDAHRKQTTSAVAPIMDMLKSFDFSRTAPKTCLYQQLTYLRHAPAGTATLVLTDGVQEGCKPDDPVGDLPEHRNNPTVVILIPKATDGDAALSKIAERKNEIARLYPEMRLDLFLTSASIRTDGLRPVLLGNKLEHAGLPSHMESTQCSCELQAESRLPSD